MFKLKVFLIMLCLNLYSESLFSQAVTINYSPPSFPGGRVEFFKFIDDNIRYPALARENVITGEVVAILAIDSIGKVKNISYEGKQLVLIEEVKRILVKIPDLTPGYLNGEAIDTTFIQEFYFSMDAYRAKQNPEIYECIVYRVPMGSPGVNIAYQKARNLYDQGVEELQKANYQEAIDIFNNAERMGFNSVDLYFNRAVAYLKVGNLESSCINFKIAADKGDNEAEALYKKKCGK